MIMTGPDLGRLEFSEIGFGLNEVLTGMGVFSHGEI